MKNAPPQEIIPMSKIVCADMVEKDDHDRYLTTLFVDADQRRALNALYAFNIEISKVLESRSEALVGEIKLQWWCDALKDMGEGTLAKHPVIQELSLIHMQKGIQIDDLILIIQARNDELQGNSAKTLKALIEYCRQTAGTLNRLAQQILSDNEQHNCSIQAENVGTAWGMMGIIRAVSFHAAMQRCQIPNDLLIEANIEQDDLFKGNFSPELTQAIIPICERAAEIVNDAIYTTSKADRRAFLLAPLTVSYIKKLRDVSCDIQKVDFHKGHMSRLLNMTWYALSGRL